MDDFPYDPLHGLDDAPEPYDWTPEDEEGDPCD